MKICIMCGVPTTGSMDGLYVCGRCDCGVRPDGKLFALEDAQAYYSRLLDWREAFDEGEPDREFLPIFEEDE